jgi:DNA polymerase
MDEREEILALVRSVKERLGAQERGGVAGLPKGKPAARVHASDVHAPSDVHATEAEKRPPKAGSGRGSAEPVARPSSEASAPPRPAGSGAAALKIARDELGDCQRCKLAGKRTNIVWGVGNPEAPLVFVGEGPGAEEDRTGEPFVGAAGQLLTRMIQAMGFARDDVYICNVVKCRPPGNRNPEPDEIAACEPFLVRQLGAIGPRMIVTLGKFAAQTLLKSDAAISALRGRFHRYQGITLMPTFHPAYLLRNPSAKREVWADLQQVMSELDRLGVARRRAPE